MPGERPDSPDVFDVMHEWIAEYLRDLHTAMPGRVESYDPTTQTATVLPLVRHGVPQPDGSWAYEDLPVVPSVPVLFPRMGPWFVSFPVARGDLVLLLCCESAIGHWRAGDGAPQYPGDMERHALSHAVALPGMFVRAGALTNAATTGNTGMALGHDSGARIEITSDGDIKLIQAPGRQVIASSGEDFVALAAKVDTALSTLKGIFSGWTPVPNDGGAALKAALTAPVTGWDPESVAATDTKAT